MAVSDAMFPQTPRKATIKGTREGGTFFMLRRSSAESMPDSSQKPMARVMVITRPKGANPVKFFTIVVRSHWMPSLVKKFWDATSL